MGLSGVQRITKFVKYLPEFGWNPIVLTSNSSAYYAFDESLLNEINEKNIQIYRTDADISKVVKKNSGSTLKYPGKFRQKIQSSLLQTFLQPDSRRFWAKQAISKADEIFKNNQIDLILTTAPPFTDFLVAHTLSKKYEVPYVLDYRDLWVDNPYYFYATIFHKNYAISLEEKILMNASRSLVITRDMKNKILSRYRFLNYNDIAILPHGFDQEDIDKAASLIQKSNKFVISHSGVFSADLTPEFFFKAVSLLISQKPEIKKDLEIRFVGVLQKKYKKQIVKYKLDEIIKLYGYLEHLESVKVLMESDVLWMMVPNSIVTPSRFYEYLGTRKPLIISSPISELTKIVENSSNVIRTDFKDINAIKNAIWEMYLNWKQNKLTLINNDITDKFDRKFLTKQLAKELAYCVKFRQ
jgi:glycosyltransferase involved in cell wall biosynthesis